MGWYALKLWSKALILFEIGFLITIGTYYILFIAWEQNIKLLYIFVELIFWFVPRKKNILFFKIKLIFYNQLIWILPQQERGFELALSDFLGKIGSDALQKS